MNSLTRRTTGKPASRPPGRLSMRVVAIALVCVFAADAGADAVKIGSTWYRRVRLVGVEDSKLIYVNQAGSQLTTQLKRVAALRVDQHPRVGEVHAAIERKDDKAALSLLADLKDTVDERWLSNWLMYQQMHASARLGRAEETVRTMGLLARSRPDAFYMADPPVAVFETTDAATARQLDRRLAAAGRQVRKHKAAAAAIAAMRAAAKRAADRPKNAMPKPAGAMASDGGRRGDANTSGDGADRPRSAVPLTRALDQIEGEDPVTSLLRQGAFEEAYKQANKQLAISSRSMARRLYQRGVAQLMVAEPTGDAAGYKSAGLDFMRVVIYFPKSSSYVGASLLEAGYVHMKIGRQDLAAALFERATTYLTEDEPELAQRLTELQEQLSKAQEQG